MNKELKKVKLKRVHEGQEFSYLPNSKPTMIAIAKYDDVTICGPLYGISCYPIKNNEIVYIKKGK